ncbi:unnamed protein product [Schistosoma turkestanicum]|nr:unnamed protein product [Schistosoma turkestanicum]
MTSNGNSSHRNLSSDSDSKETESVSSPLIVTSRPTSSNEPSIVLTSSDPAVNVKLIVDTQGCVTLSVPTSVDCQSSDDEQEVSDGNSQSTVLPDNDAIDVLMSCVSVTEHGEQQVSLSVLDCDTNAVLSFREMSYTTKEEFHSTDASVARNDATCLTQRNHNDDNNLDVTDVTNDLSTLTNADQTSVPGDGELNIVPMLCHLESSGDEEMSKSEILPLHIIYGSRTSVDKSASRASSYLLFGAMGGGLTTHPHEVESKSLRGYDQLYDVLHMFVWVNWIRFILPLGHATIDRGIKDLMGMYRFIV